MDLSPTFRRLATVGVVAGLLLGCSDSGDDTPENPVTPQQEQDLHDLLIERGIGEDDSQCIVDKVGDQMESEEVATVLDLAVNPPADPTDADRALTAEYFQLTAECGVSLTDGTTADTTEDTTADTTEDTTEDTTATSAPSARRRRPGRGGLAGSRVVPVRSPRR